MRTFLVFILVKPTTGAKSEGVDHLKLKVNIILTLICHGDSQRCYGHPAL